MKIIFLRSINFILCNLVLLIVSGNIKAEDTPITISISVPIQYYENMAYSTIISEFEAENPNIQVHINRITDFTPFFIQSHEGARHLATTGDVLYIDSGMMNPDIILNGAFLDLNPLIGVDTNLNPDDFYPNVWDAFYWDNSRWAIPLSFNPILLSYDPDVFDRYSLGYLNSDWTAYDLIESVNQLVEQGDSGLSLPLTGEAWLLRSLLNENLLDTQTFPPTPRLNTPDIIDALTLWQTLDTTQNESSPLNLSTDLYEFLISPNRQFILLPNGQAGMNVNGLAISAGTLYPEEAYNFIQFLSHHPQILSLGQYALPARQSIEITNRLNTLEAHDYDLIMDAVPNMLSFSQLRYMGYLTRETTIQSINIPDTLALLQEQATQEQQILWEQAQDSNRIAVNTPPQRRTYTPQDVILRFGFHAYGASIQNVDEALWDNTISEFVANDPQVTQIEMEILINQVNFTETFDCFFTPHGVTHLQPNTLFSLDPLMMSDSDFNPSDFLPYVFDFVTFEGQTYGYPFLVQYEVLDYNIPRFEQANLNQPNHDWTVNDFIVALEMLKPIANDAPVLGTTRVVSTDLLQLIASFGGLPIDYRTYPPTANFTTATSFEAIRNALGLIELGYIQYIPRTGGVDFSQSNTIMKTNSHGFLGGAYPMNERIGTVLYPTGSSYRPIALGVGAFYISQNTLYPEACYRWISQIVDTPQLLSHGMYARYSSMNDPIAEIVQGNEQITFYREIIEQLQLPNTIIFPSPWVGSGSEVGVWLEHWLYEAFSAYLIDGEDLEQALANAQLNADAYLACVGNLSNNDHATDYYVRYEQYRDCALSIDPDI